jgi:hypothetical protein
VSEWQYVKVSTTISSLNPASCPYLYS